MTGPRGVPGSAQPLRLSFDVACSPEHAFRVWTSRIGTWWPPDHTVTGHAEQVVLQGDVGGRIYEQTADGTSGSTEPAAAEKSAIEDRHVPAAAARGTRPG